MDPDELAQEDISRRHFLELTAAGTATAAGLGALSEVAAPTAAAAPLDKDKPTLKIIQWSHFVPQYDKWFDNVYTKQWGQKNNANVVVDHISYADLPARAASEVAAGSGHDLFGFLSPPPSFEDHVIDVADIVQETEKKVGKIIPLAYRSTYNPKTKKYFGFSDMWVPDPILWRKDLFDQVGVQPHTWDDVRKAGPKLKAMGHPLGVGFSNGLDSNMALIATLQCFGAYIQDADANVTINSKHTVECISFMADIFKTGETPEVLAWNAASNNLCLDAGRCSLIVNAISAYRTAKPSLAKTLWAWPIPKGPVQRLGLEHVMSVYVIWKFAQQKELAKKFLVDLETHYKAAFLNSLYYNFPSFQNAVPDLKSIVAYDKQSQPHDKLKILGEFEKWSTNLGYPGFSNAAIDETFNKFLIPQMFAQTATGKMSAAESAKWAENQLKPIFAKWRSLGKI